MKPTHVGTVGQTVFDGEQTWVYVPPEGWVTELPTVNPPIDPIVFPMRPAARMNTGQLRPWIRTAGWFLLIVAAVLTALWLWSL